MSFSHFSSFCVILYLAKLATSSIRVNRNSDRNGLEIQIDQKLERKCDTLPSVLLFPTQFLNLKVTGP